MSSFVQYRRGANYSLFNYDWSINLKYIVISYYIPFIQFCISIITYFKLIENQNCLMCHNVIIGL